MSNDLRWIYKQKIKSCYVGIWSKFLAWISFPHMIDSSQIEKLYLFVPRPSYFPSWMSFLDVSGLYQLGFSVKKGKMKNHSVVLHCINHILSFRHALKISVFFVLFELAGIIKKGGVSVRKHRVYHAGDLYHLGILRPKFFCIFMWRLDIKIRKHRSLDHIFFFFKLSSNSLLLR